MLTARLRAERVSSEELSSGLSGFHRFSLQERRDRLQKILGLTEAQMEKLVTALSEGAADQMVENAIGVFGLPLGICTNLLLNGQARVAPMVVEEPSVIAAASFAAKLLRSGGGVHAQSTEAMMIGQIQLLDVPDAEAAERAIQHAALDLLAMANGGRRRLTAVGGGARSIEVRHLAPLGEDDPSGPMMIVHLMVDVRDAMGANAINSMCESLAPRLESVSGGRARLRILSNLSDGRTVTVRGRVPFESLENRGADSGEALARGIEEASVFAERDPYRAATHNKGIMNGIDAVLIALGQDWRAVEAGAHAFAAREGRYTALARWRVRADGLHGEMTLPMAVGTVGGVIKTHPAVQASFDLADITSAKDLGELAASVGLAQNLGALRALAAEGIQSGHMRLHARNVSVAAGAEGDEIPRVSEAIADAQEVNVDAARAVLDRLRGGKVAR
ncbi:MAG: hydroxymethylglutaryl-CoA reductase, degradative [Myxococcota bacterium]